MVIFVVVANTLIGFACLFAAWQVWKLRRKLAKVVETLDSVERSVYNVLHPAPPFIIKGQRGSSTLRKTYRNLQPKLEQLQQFVALLSLGRVIWQRSGGMRSSRSPKRSASRRA